MECKAWLYRQLESGPRFNLGTEDVTEKAGRLATRSYVSSDMINTLELPILGYFCD